MTATAPSPSTAERSKPARNPIGLIALGVAVVAFLLAVIPPTSFIAWLPAVAAIVLAIIGLTRTGQSKGMAVTALILAPVAWIIAIVVALGTTVVALDDAINDPGSSSEQPGAAEEPAEPVEEAPAQEAPAAAGIGTPVTGEEGVTYTVTAFACGIPEAGPEFLVETATGQFCEVRATMANGGTDSFDMYTGNIKGFIDGSQYDPNGIASSFGGESFSKTVNPGLSIDMVLYFDVPADRTLQTVEFSESSFFSDPVSISLG